MLQVDLLDISALAPAAIIEVLDPETLHTCLRPPSLMSSTPGYEIPGVMGNQGMPSSRLSAVRCCLGKASVHFSCSAEHAVLEVYLSYWHEKRHRSRISGSTPTQTSFSN